MIADMEMCSRRILPRELASTGELQHGANVLDIGAGTGRVAIAFGAL